VGNANPDATRDSAISTRVFRDICMFELMVWNDMDSQRHEGVRKREILALYSHV